jgi:FkbM family methyltransferase
MKKSNLSLINLYFKFFFESLYLDYFLLFDNLLNFNQKIDFLLKKYILIFKHFIVKFKFGQSKINLFNKEYFYDSHFGLGSLQGILTRHKYLLSFMNIKNSEVKTVLDIGANIGNFTILSHKLFPKAKIFSFEPIPFTFSILEKNIGKQKNIKIFNKAVGEKTGSQLMSFDEDSSGLSRFSNKGTEVKVTSLDDFIKEEKISTIDLLKIDTETFESYVLKGATKSLAKTKFICIEITLESNPNYTISSLFSLLKGEGYDFQIVSFRNASGTSEGEISWMDALLINTEYKN